jgi:hypothetical protein
MSDRTCGIDGCGKPHLARGLCQMHYARTRNTGDPGPAGRQRRMPGSFGPCASEGCDRAARRNGLCSSCSAKTRRDSAGSCTIPGCTGRADARGLCGKHYQQIRKGVLNHPLAAEILRDVPCSVKDCGAPAYAKGMCGMHWQRERLTGDPGEAERRKVRWEQGQQCAISGCERPPRWGVYCGSHMRRFRRFGITEAEIAALLARQKNRCAICKSAKPYGSGDWAIDHDHATGQVRGLLCSKCNLALGLLGDDPKAIAAALRYVSRHRQMQLFGPSGPIRIHEGSQ